jgi:hypothetical protein
MKAERALAQDVAARHWSTPATALVAALDALEVGDQREATLILLAVLHEDGDTVHRSRCPFCSWTGEWPGLLDAHILHAHPYVGEGVVDFAA